MPDDEEFTPEERKALRRMLREYEAQRDREAQERARKLMEELTDRFGPLDRP